MHGEIAVVIKWTRWRSSRNFGQQELALNLFGLGGKFLVCKVWNASMLTFNYKNSRPSPFSMHIYNEHMNRKKMLIMALDRY